MILFGLAGYAVERLLGVAYAVPVAVLAGLVVAPLVPARTACGAPPPRGPGPSD